MANQSSLPRIAILHKGVGDAFRYRCVHLREQLGLLGLPCQVRDLRPVDGRGIEECDLLFLHRVPLDGFLGKQLRMLQRKGALVLFDTDDLVFEVEDALSLSRSVGDHWLKRALYRQDLKGLRRALHLADGAVVATQALAGRARELAKPTWVHRNAFSFEMLEISERAFRERGPRGKKVVIGYASGTPTHENDLALLKPALKVILGSYPATELWLVGHIDGGTDWGGLSGRITRMPFTSWRNLPRVLADFDINLAPVQLGRPFCETKSEVKYVEAALVRVPTVASATESFSFGIRHGSNGFLASGEGDWLEGLERLVVEPDLRVQMGRNAYEDAMLRYHPHVRSGELRVILEEVLSRGGRGRFDLGHGSTGFQGTRGELAPTAKGDEQGADTVPDRSHLYKAWYSLRYDSLQTFFLRMLSFLSMRLSGRGTAAGA